MRPPNHMPCPADEATVAVLGEATFKRGESDLWEDNTFGNKIPQARLTRYGASFYKPVPSPPENTRELTEEDLGEGHTYKGWYLSDSGEWHHSSEITNLTVWVVFPDQPWRCRVPIEKKVVAWKVGDPDNPGYSVSASFATEELRDRAVKEANGREG